MTILAVDIDTLSGGPADMDRRRGQVALVVNVASRCGLTPQYAGRQALHDTYAGRGVIGPDGTVAAGSGAQDGELVAVIEKLLPR